MALSMGLAQQVVIRMTDVRVRNLDDWIVDSLRLQARAHGNSLEGELRELLRQHAIRPKTELAEELRSLRTELGPKSGKFSDSAEIIRQIRDERG
jgi:plasmid stability protein